MIVYEQTLECDLLIAALWGRINRSGDLERLLPISARTPSAFFSVLAPPTVTVLECDDQGPWFCAWSKPEMSGGTFGLWIAPERRSSPKTLRLLLDTLERFLTLYPVLFSITKQEGLLKGHERLGYTVHGPIPHLFDGEPAWFVYLTREGFSEAKCRFKAKTAFSEKPESAQEGAQSPPPMP